MIWRNQSKFKEGVDKLQIHGSDEEMRYKGEPTKNLEAKISI